MANRVYRENEEYWCIKKKHSIKQDAKSTCVCKKLSYNAPHTDEIDGNEGSVSLSC
mgnify:CR=1 FL=1